jgi:hypothetical protein
MIDLLTTQQQPSNKLFSDRLNYRLIVLYLLLEKRNPIHGTRMKFPQVIFWL